MSGLPDRSPRRSSADSATASHATDSTDDATARHGRA